MTPALRAAAREDVPVLADIWRDAAFGPDATPPVEPDYLDHELATGTGVVAEEDGRAVGFGVLLTRGRVSNLAELFVRRGAQSRGIGRLLFERLLDDQAPILATVAAHDPRALALYLRHGLVPRWPHYYLEGRADRMAVGPGVEVVPAEWDDPEWLAWDRAAAGRDRAVDHGFLRARRAGVALWFRRAGRPVGYGCVQLGTDSATIGPLGSEADAAAACVAAALEWARARRARLRIALFGPHPALAPLLGAGLRIVDMDTYMATPASDVFDPARYVPMSAEFL